MVPKPFDNFRNHLSKDSMSATLITFGREIVMLKLITPQEDISERRTNIQTGFKFGFEELAISGKCFT